MVIRAGVDDFGGTVVHPQHWPADLDLSGQKVVVIGSGATAITIVPAIAGETEHVTMLQRTPTYVLSRPGRDPVAKALRHLPAYVVGEGVAATDGEPEDDDPPGQVGTAAEGPHDRPLVLSRGEHHDRDVADGPQPAQHGQSVLVG